MPFIRVITPAGLLSDAERKDIAETLTVGVMKIETGGYDTVHYRAISKLVFDELPPGRWASGGQISDEPTALVEVRMPEGAVDQDRRDRIAEAAYRVLTNVSPALAQCDGVTRVWTHIFEIPEGNWGVAGRTVSFADVRRIAAGIRD